jgi:hypothetical protein
MSGKEVKQTIMFFLTRIMKYILALKRKKGEKDLGTRMKRKRM